MLKQITICVISCMFITILGCSKDEGSTPSPPTPPPVDKTFKISNLVYSPSTISINPKLPTFSITGTIDFQYAGDGIAKLRLTSAIGLDTTILISNGAGFTSGKVSGYFEFTRPTTPAQFSFDIWMIDLKGVASNKLSGTISVIIDDSGINWSRVAISISDFQEVRWFNNQFIAGGNVRTIYTSPDGTIWTRGNTPYLNVPTSIAIKGLAWSGTKYVAVGNDGTIFSSSDAVNWLDHTLPQENKPDLFSVDWGNGKFVVVGEGNYPIGSEIIYSSQDGMNWSKNELAMAGATLNSVTWAGNQFVAVGSVRTPETVQPLVMTSADGLTWTTRTLSKNSSILNDVIWTGNKIVILGSGPGAVFVATSTDGANWAINDLASNIGISALTYSGNTYIGVGNGIYRSVDGINWSNSVPPNNLMYFYHSVAWSGFNYVATGGGVYEVWVSP